MKKCLFFFPLFLCLSLAFGQDFILLQKPVQEGVALRWFPGDFEAWNTHLAEGYLVERAPETGAFQRITAAPIIPTFPANNAVGELLQQIMQYQDSLEVIRTTPNGPRLLSGLYRTYLRGAAASPNGIQQSGLYFLDDTAEPGKRYRYRLTTVQGQRLADASFYRGEADELPSLRIKDREYVADLQWDHKIGPSNFQAYRLEQSDDGVTYQPITKGWGFPKSYLLPAREMRDTFQLLDTVPTLNATYFYRLVGISAFGETIIGNESRFLAKDQTPPARPTGFTVAAAENAAEVNLSWGRNDEAGDLAGYRLFRSRYPDSAYVPLIDQLLPPGQEAYVDKDIIREGDYYYRIVAVDATGNERTSFRRSAVFPDKTPPAIPEGLQLDIADNGSVEISWNANKEEDMRGYQLAIARYVENEFVPVTSLPLQTTSYQDTLSLNFVNREVYYQIAALDQRGNLSPYSEPVLGLLPDTIKPIKPLLEKPLRQGDTLTLTWQPLEEEDLAYVEVYARRSTATTWNKPERSPSLQQYQRFGLDTLTGDWVYAVRAVDAAGNESPLSNERLLKAPNRSSVVPRPEKLAYRRLNEEQVELNWSYPLTKAPVSFLVFRLGADGKTPVLSGQTRERKIQLAAPSVGTSNDFFILAQDEKRRYSAPSEQVSVDR